MCYSLGNECLRCVGWGEEDDYVVDGGWVLGRVWNPEVAGRMGCLDMIA